MLAGVCLLLMELGERIGVIEPPDADLCRYLGPERNAH
jgi:hypothetical protein